jgi:beta-lactamase class A
MNINDGHVSYPLHGENSNTDINRVYLETDQSDEVFEPSTFEKLCRLMLKDHAKCRNDAKDDQGPD